MSPKTQAIIQLNTLLARANRLDLPEAQIYKQELNSLLREENTMSGLVQGLLDRVQTVRNRSISGVPRNAYTVVINAIARHQATYGEDRVQDLVHYLDELSARPGSNIFTSEALKFYANVLQRRLNQQHALELEPPRTTYEQRIDEEMRKQELREMHHVTLSKPAQGLLQCLKDTPDNTLHLSSVMFMVAEEAWYDSTETLEAALQELVASGLLEPKGQYTWTKHQ